ncbi:MAG: flavodoxin-dependent (E)-4-hydroxy-3-methylbut-2-enyl-diphosphate synthase, partial [Clostridia bacterium]|nr:flavodoxin-dependent (E)-4-hydroxy-3-methylbut-2-enyl-diphosphate synthase [Clostridia bacterium]
AYVANIKKPLKIAVMGCEVNGPGECKDADLGLAGSNGKFVFFKQGKIYKTVPQETAFEEFTKEIDKLAK